MPGFYSIKQYLTDESKSISDQLNDIGGYSAFKAKLIERGDFTADTIPYFAAEIIYCVSKSLRCIDMCKDAIRVDLGVYGIIPLRHRDIVACDSITLSPVSFYDECHAPTQGYIEAIKNKPSLVIYNDVLQNAILYYELISGGVSCDIIPDELLEYLPSRLAFLINTNRTYTTIETNNSFKMILEQYPNDHDLAVIPYSLALAALLENPNDFMNRYHVNDQIYLAALLIRPEIILFNNVRENIILDNLLKVKSVQSLIKSLGLEDKVCLMRDKSQFFRSDYTIKDKYLAFTSNKPFSYHNFTCLLNYEKAYIKLTEDMMVGMLLANPLKFFRTNDVTESVYISAFKVNPMIAFFNTGNEDEILIKALLSGKVQDTFFIHSPSLHSFFQDELGSDTDQVNALRYVGKAQRSAYYDAVKAHRACDVSFMNRV
jgi:hypothetical protein